MKDLQYVLQSSYNVGSPFTLDFQVERKSPTVGDIAVLQERGQGFKTLELIQCMLGEFGEEGNHLPIKVLGTLLSSLRHDILFRAVKMHLANHIAQPAEFNAARAQYPVNCQALGLCHQRCLSQKKFP